MTKYDFRFDRDFKKQEENWIRWSHGKTNQHQKVKCMTAILLEGAKQENAVADVEKPDPIYPIDAEAFEQLVKTLPRDLKAVYVAHTHNKFLVKGIWKVLRYANTIVQQRKILCISEFLYTARKQRAISHLKHFGGLV